ncbi:hypothetical protein [Pseudomonas sp. Irchel 3A7]|uniref:hypothetical protein n=1 Tax=Pseudomonas sp. Irchel 3A7 TaxID=2008913 RepID=UPI000BA2BCBD|nr:hypothetical protein [Pseudomonas sp. Irchel 3A7]
MENTSDNVSETISSGALNEPITAKDWWLSVNVGELTTYKEGDTRKITNKNWVRNGDGTYTILLHTTPVIK